MQEVIYPKETLVHVTSYGPLFGRTGTIRAIDIIGEDGPLPVAFSLVSFQDEPGKELWLEQDAVAAVFGNAAQWDGNQERNG